MYSIYHLLQYLCTGSVYDQVLSSYRIVVSVCATAGVMRFAKSVPLFDVVFVDEASHATEAEVRT